MKKQGVTIEFTFPAYWVAQDFIEELFEAYREMGGESATQVSAQVVGSWVFDKTKEEQQ